MIVFFLFTVLFYKEDIFAKCILQTFCILAENIFRINDEVMRRFFDMCQTVYLK